MASVYVVPDRSLSFVAVAVGLTHGWSAVFVRQQIEDALQSGDAAAIRHATHVLAHEAGHVVQHHGLWRTVAASLAPLVLSHVYRDSGVGSLMFVAAVLTAAGLTFYLAGECAAERFAARFAGPDASSFVAMEAGE